MCLMFFHDKLTIFYKKKLLPNYKSSFLFLINPNFNHKSKTFPHNKVVRFRLIWYGQKDLNLHELPHQNLNLARLPIPPCPHIVDSNQYTNSPIPCQLLIKYPSPHKLAISRQKFRVEAFG